MIVPDPYKILQVDPDADREVIEAAYRRLARKFHPDVSTEPDAIVRMVQINQAWEMLRDPVKRGSVDRARQRAAGTSARVVAADGREHAEARGHKPAGTTPGTADPTPGSRAGSRPGSGQSWPFPGMVDPTSGPFTNRADPEPPGPTNRGSSTDSPYRTRTMGVGAAGPPPGSPSGSIITFGRYQGWTLGEVARRDLEYLEWLDRIPIGRAYHAEIDALLRHHARRDTPSESAGRRKGLFRRR